MAQLRMQAPRQERLVSMVVRALQGACRVRQPHSISFEEFIHAK